jgi:GNAT superfamily N-acetyltransferase
MLTVTPTVAREVRALPRRRVFLGEGLTFELICRGRTIAAEAIDLTLEGLGLALTHAPLLPLPGEVVTVRYTGPGASGATHEAVVAHTGSLRSGERVFPRVGLTLLGEHHDPGVRWPCPDALPAFAVASCPWFYREQVRMRVLAVGAAGMTLCAESTALLRGMELDFVVHLPFIGAQTARGRVMSAHNVAWVDPPRSFHNALARYLLAADDALTPARLRAGGLDVGSVEYAVGYGYATSTADREAVLALRLRAHQAEGSLQGYSSLEEIRSVYDEHARHIVARFGDRIVGYVRLIFVDRIAARSQYVSLGGHEVPEWLWEAGFAEAGAGAMDPEFQGAGLFTPLMAHAIRVAVTAGHRYVLGACDDALLAMYGSMGFEKLEERVCEPKPGWRFRSHLIVLDAERVPPAIASAVAFAQDVVQPAPQGAHRGRVVA